MKYKAPIYVIVIAAGAWWLLSTSSSDSPAYLPDHKPVAQPEPESEPAGSPTPFRRDVERPRLPEPATGDSPREPVERADFDRRPWNPSEELKETYERRAKLIAGFDRFREETGISQERADAIMMLLYDYQETVKPLKKKLLDGIPYRDEWEFEYLLRQEAHDVLLITNDACDAIYEMLSPEEMRSWTRNVDHINVWLLLQYWPHSKPMIVQVSPP